MRLLALATVGTLLSGCSFLGYEDYASTQTSTYTANCGTATVAQYAPCGGAVYTAPVKTTPAYNPCYGAPQPVNPCAASAYPATRSHFTGHYVDSYGSSSAAYAQPQDVYPTGAGYNYPVANTSPRLRGSVDDQFANDYVYGSLGAVMYDIDDELWGVQGRIGYQSGYVFGAEVEGSLGVLGRKENIVVNQGGVNVNATANTKINYDAGIFAVARIPMTRNINVLGRVGYHRGELQTKVDTGTVQATGKLTDDGLAYGGGVEFNANERDAIRVDYTRYETDVTPTSDTVSVSYVRKF